MACSTKLPDVHLSKRWLGKRTTSMFTQPKPVDPIHSLFVYFSVFTLKIQIKNTKNNAKQSFTRSTKLYCNARYWRNTHFLLDLFVLSFFLSFLHYFVFPSFFLSLILSFTFLSLAKFVSHLTLQLSRRLQNTCTPVSTLSGDSPSVIRGLIQTCVGVKRDKKELLSRNESWQSCEVACFSRNLEIRI